MTDILEILEASAAEIRAGRQKAESLGLFIDNLTIRLAIRQLQKGPLGFEPDPQRWEKVRKLQEASRLIVTHAGEVYLDGRELTPELLDQVKDEQIGV